MPAPHSAKAPAKKRATPKRRAALKGGAVPKKGAAAKKGAARTSGGGRSGGKGGAGKGRANPLWGGGFQDGPEAAMAAINVSLGFDHRLWREDLAVSRAHAAMLARAGIISKADGARIASGLAEVERELEDGVFPFREALEDIHMNIEARLAELIGPETAGRLHTARSRNDQATAGLRLWLRAACDRLDAGLEEVQAGLIARASAEAATPLPGYTHLQRAQVVSLGHWCLAWAEAFGRDRERLADARRRINRSPLGAAALAGTGFPVRPQETAAALGFEGALANSMDAVAARDFALEFLAAGAVLSVTLSRLAEELVLWSSAEFAFIRFSEGWSTGSSIMPQKRNPDAAELVRGKSGRVIGGLTGLLAAVKGLPLAYAKDLQEDKEAVFDAADTLELCLQATAGMVRDFVPDRAAMERAAAEGGLAATDLADWLVETRGLPFRAAHERVAALAAEVPDLRAASPSALERALGPLSRGEHKALARLLEPASALKRRNSPGGTAPARVREAARQAERRFLQPGAAQAGAGPEGASETRRNAPRAGARSEGAGVARGGKLRQRGPSGPSVKEGQVKPGQKRPGAAQAGAKRRKSGARGR